MIMSCQLFSHKSFYYLYYTPVTDCFVCLFFSRFMAHMQGWGDKEIKFSCVFSICQKKALVVPSLFLFLCKESFCVELTGRFWGPNRRYSFWLNAQPLCAIVSRFMSWHNPICWCYVLGKLQSFFQLYLLHTTTMCVHICS
jgi:hypothetical protein